jgi:RNA polymerase sigma factor (sigma-70 family)
MTSYRLRPPCAPAIVASAVPTRLKDLPPQLLADLRRDLERMLRARRHTRQDAEDLAQDTLCKGLAAGELRSPRAWLRRVATHAGITLLRKRRGQERLGRRVPLDPALLPFDSFAETAGKKRSDALWAAIDQLPDRLREFVALRMDGLTFVAIATEFGLHESAVRRRYGEALDFLRELLKACDEA